jgi:hypothetical protein
MPISCHAVSIVAQAISLIATGERGRLAVEIELLVTSLSRC